MLRDVKVGVHCASRSKHHIARTDNGAVLTNPSFHLALDDVNNLVVTRMIVEIEAISRTQD